MLATICMNKHTSTPMDLLAKVAAATKMADSAASSDSPLTRLGSVVVYAGVVDLLVIQACRLVEEVMLKSDLSRGMPPRFFPNEDGHFYGRRLSTAKLLKEIRKWLSPRQLPEHEKPEVNEVIKAADEFVGRVFGFLDERDFLFHRIGHPDTQLDDWLARVDRAIAAYRTLLQSHTSFAIKVAPYRLTKVQQAQIALAKALRGALPK